jgi:Xaa-Pro aminopeptidase
MTQQSSAITWDNARLKRDRLAHIQTQMVKHNIGGMYLGVSEYKRYLLNLDVPSSKVFIPVEGEALSIVRKRDLAFVQDGHSNVQLRTSGDDDWERDDPNVTPGVRPIIDLMRQHGVAGERLAVDSLPPSLILGLSAQGVEIAEAEPLIEYAWTVKTEDEVALYRHIGDHYTSTMTAFRDAIRPGVTEKELASTVVSAWYAAGGEDVAQLNVCSGENMNPWRRWPTDRKVVEGELVGIDFHGRGLIGLRGDASRTYLVGNNSTAEQRDLYRIAHDYMRECTDLLRAGRTIREVMDAVPKVPDRYRSQLLNYNIAHGMGLGSSGYPHMDPRKAPIDDVLYPNQVLAVESYFAEEGSPLAVKLEDQIVVRDGAPEIIGAGMPHDARLA